MGVQRYEFGTAMRKAQRTIRHRGRWRFPPYFGGRSRTIFLQKWCYTANEEPQPQLLLAFGLEKVNPREFNPPWKSISIPMR